MANFYYRRAFTSDAGGGAVDGGDGDGGGKDAAGTR
jgi:hypothetical protein